MPVQGVHTRKGFLAPFTRVRPDVQMEGLVPLAIVLSCEALVAPRPLAFKWPFLVVGPNVPSEVEMPSKRAATSWHWTLEIGLGSASVRARLARSRRRDMHSLDRLGQTEASIVGVVVARQHSRTRVWTVVRARTVRAASGSLMATIAPRSHATLIHISRHARRDRHGRWSERAIGCGVYLRVLVIEL